MTDTTAPDRIGSGTATALVATAFLVAMLGTTLPTPIYPLYEARYGFGGFVVTVVFATYAVGVIAALLVLGGLSDRIGRKPVLYLGLALALVSALVFLVPAMPALFVGRVLSGLSAGVFTGTATAAILDHAPPDGKARAGLVAAAVNMLGLGLGPVVAGLLVELAPWPMELPYLVHIALVVLVGIGLLVVPERVARRSFRVEPLRLGGLPPEVRGTFVRAAIPCFAGFAVLGMFTAVSPAVLSQVLGRPNHLLAGVTVFLVFLGSAVGQVGTALLSERTAMPLGCAMLVVGVLTVGGGIVAVSYWLFAAGAVVAGLGQGISFRTGLTAVGSEAPPAHRGQSLLTRAEDMPEALHAFLERRPPNFTGR
ncbi:MFS transporter [Pseudonocardia pini]|uniref:MFS transporter n=1 Tax=Pseudonocardia pini TaxID=2758030 RepID=UPI0015F009B3|nr:MFS transporter [Pseudonocardia pini]